MPYDEPGEKTDLVLTGVVVKSTSWGAGYLNVFADVVLQERGGYSLELSFQRNLPKGWSLGPGVSLVRPGNGDDELDVSLGINIAKTFGG